MWRKKYMENLLCLSNTSSLYQYSIQILGSQSSMVYEKIKLFFNVEDRSKWNCKAIFAAIIALIICPH